MQPVARTALRLVAAAAVALLAATAAVAVLEDVFGVANASPVYLVAVVLVALLVGTGGAIVTAIGSAILYNFWFTEPRFTFEIRPRGPPERRAAAVRGRRRRAARRHPAQARGDRDGPGARGAGAVRDQPLAGDPLLDGRGARSDPRVLIDEVGLERAWVGIGPDPSGETIAADTGEGRPPSQPGRLRVLQRMPGDQPAKWVLVQRQVAGARPRAVGGDIYRVRIEASGELLGSIWAIRARALGEPDLVQTRLVAATADQVGQAIALDRSAAGAGGGGRPPERRAQVGAAAVGVARPADAARDDPRRRREPPARTASLGDGGRRASADAIEREVAYLDRLVTNLLDLSRIEAGALRPRREVFDLDDLLGRALDRTRARLAGGDSTWTSRLAGRTSTRCSSTRR